LLVILASAQDKKAQVSVFGGINYHPEYGTIDDYVPGENDFPIMPAHSPINFGFAVSYFITNHIGIEVDGRLTSSSKVTLTDPSDQDTLEIDSPKHFTMTFNFIYRIIEGRLSPYLVVGGGFDRISVQEQTYISAYGFKVTPKALSEDEIFDPLIQIGAGIQYLIVKNLGIRFDFRYIRIFDEPNHVITLNTVLGLFLKF
jgi:outer membrane protein W